MIKVAGLCALSFAPGQCLQAQAGTTLFVDTDLVCNWKLDGRPMGQLMPDRPQIVLVSAGEHLIEASAVDARAATHSTVRVEKVEKKVDIQLRSQSEAFLSKPHQALETDTWIDARTGLMWAVQDNGSDVNCQEANVYCAGLDLGSFKDWRLPSIEELKGIYDSSSATRELFESGMVPDLHIKGNRKLTGSEWSSTLKGSSDNPSIGAWMFNFGDPRRTPGNAGKPATTFFTSHYSLRALCVRRP